MNMKQVKVLQPNVWSLQWDRMLNVDEVVVMDIDQLAQTLFDGGVLSVVGNPKKSDAVPPIKGNPPSATGTGITSLVGNPPTPPVRFPIMEEPPAKEEKPTGKEE